MNNLRYAKDFVTSCDRLSSLYVGLGSEYKVFCLYVNWVETVWGKDQIGRPIPRDEFRTHHLVNLSTDFKEANEKAKKYCEEWKVSKILYLTTEKEAQRGFDYKTPEELKAEKVWAERWRKICGDVNWFHRMSERWDWSDKNKIRTLFEEALSDRLRFKALKGRKKSYKKARSLPIKTKCWRGKFIQEAKASQYVGNIGEKVELELTHTRFASFDGYWGQVNIYTFVDQTGNVFIYKGSTVLKDKDYNFVEKGDKVVVTGFVKEHTSYAPKTFDKCVLKQTRLQRVKVLNLTKCNNSELKEFIRKPQKSYDKFGNPIVSA